MSRSYPPGESGWRMYCDRCNFIDPDRFDHQPPLEHYVPKGWFIGTMTDLCPSCYTKDTAPDRRAHSVMATAEADQ